MNEKIKNGGPAFPLTGMNYRNGQQVQAVFQNGMSLRDYFAAKAMQAALTTNDCYPDENWRIGIAMDAYKMASANSIGRSITSNCQSAWGKQ